MTRYNFLGSCASASGSLVAGMLSTALVEHYAISEVAAYRVVFVEYGAISVVLMMLVCLLSRRIERGHSSPAAEESLIKVKLFGALSMQPPSKKNTHDAGSGEEELGQPLLLHDGLDGDLALGMPGGRLGDADGTSRAVGSPAGASVRGTGTDNHAQLAPGKDSGDDEGRGRHQGRGSSSSSPIGLKSALGLSSKSWQTVAHLSALFATDAFASAMITGTLLAYYFQVSSPPKAFGMHQGYNKLEENFSLITGGMMVP